GVRASPALWGCYGLGVIAAPAGGGAGIEHIYWVEGDWFGDGEAVDALTYVRHCPVTRHMLRVSEPFFWTKNRAQQGERYRIVRTPRGAGLHGVQIPVFGPAGLEGAVSLGGERIDASPPARLALSLVGTAAFQAARRLFAPAAGEGESRLSAREREVLSWTAIGRRQADIAAMLGLSERTVENHLRRIRQRLGAATTAQAISVAIRLGEIAPERR
ncbi:PA1136 family autoinducer-binding transcriptional regulator, partial [Serratia marcescens]|uniref:PA1136 family autoinducer-binding transcriptional regulator n=1 Tax=Serratia marcescens TaxID=615 RepID=UPI001EE482C4